MQLVGQLLMQFNNADGINLLQASNFIQLIRVTNTCYLEVNKAIDYYI